LFIKYFIEWKLEAKTEVTGRRERRISSYWMTLRKAEDVEIEVGSTRSLRLGTRL